VSTWSSREELVHKVVTLHAQGVGRRAIARSQRVSRNTVSKILREHQAARKSEHSALPTPPKRAPRSKKIDAFAPKVAELLTRFPDITAQRVFEELRDAGFSGGSTAVKEYVHATRPRPKATPSLATPVYAPGQMAESDWSPHTIDFTVAGRKKVEIFSYVLCHSRRNSYSVFEHADSQSLMDGHELAFQRFGGAAHECKYDCQKSVVLRWEGQQPIYNPRFLAFAAHYEFRVVACRPGKPNDKPHVERGFWGWEQSFLNGRSFRDIDDMRAQLARWERDVHDRRPHKKTRRAPLEMFEAEEKEKLVPLPSHPYDTARVLYCLCSIDGFVAWSGNRYAVPYEHVTDFLPVRITQTELFVYAADLHVIARHELAPRGAGNDVDPLGIHRRWPHRHRVGVADLDQLRAAFGQMGQASAAFFDKLASEVPRQCTFRARQILLLRERYTTHDVEAALAHALAFGALDNKAVARILFARSRPRTLDEYVAEQACRRLEERLGQCHTQPRDLREYDRLPTTPPAGAIAQQEKDPCPNDTTPPTPTPSPSRSDVASESSD
jgi:transposase